MSSADKYGQSMDKKKVVPDNIKRVVLYIPVVLGYTLGGMFFFLLFHYLLPMGFALALWHDLNEKEDVTWGRFIFQILAIILIFFGGYAGICIFYSWLANKI